MRRIGVNSVACSLLLCVGVALFSKGCNGSKQPRRLPILGERVVKESSLGVAETLYHRIPDFRLLNQDSQWVSAKTFENKVYVADFFFTSCPTICPEMAKQLLSVYTHYQGDPRVGILSHSIDPSYDRVEVLRAYAEGLQVNSDTWHFVTGDMDSIQALARQYLSVVVEDSTEAGGYLHSGHFLLLDTKRRIRGVYDGTSEQATDSLVADIAVLLDEES